MTLALYGIPNCDQVKKARTWLASHDQTVVFHDFKKAGISRALIESWLQHVAWEVLINRKGTTWRALADERKGAIIDADSAIVLMLEAPSVIKRPVLVTPSHTVVGFSDDVYQQLFKK
ncbi:ArsC family reductase [Actimicrobium antarcticum]|uniref:ArsC family reductase n=1 Tax=Actimicrobium antarcticum TaxID=1051899 RepID=A0ABP7TNF5_9BURK